MHNGDHGQENPMCRPLCYGRSGPGKGQLCQGGTRHSWRHRLQGKTTALSGVLLVNLSVRISKTFSDRLAIERLCRGIF